MRYLKYAFLFVFTFMFEDTNAQTNHYSILTSTQIDYNDLQHGFLKTPNESGLRCYWWWLNSMATKESITRDLEQMKARGYGGASLFDAGSSSYKVARKTAAGPVFMSPQWMELYKHTVKEAERVGIELSVNVQSGWNPGAPTITPEFAMKKIVFSETNITGGKAIQLELLQPPVKLMYKDVMVQAVKYSESPIKNDAILNWDKKSFNKSLGKNGILPLHELHESYSERIPVTPLQKNELYVWGGFSYTAPFTYKDGYRLSQNNGKWVWEDLPQLPLPLTWAGTYAVGSRIYLLGGADFDEQRFYTLTDRDGAVNRLGARLIMLDTENLDKGWSELAPCPGTPPCLMASAVVDGKIYSIGGVAVSDSGAYLNVMDSWRYDPHTDSWQRLRDFPMSGTGSSPGILVYKDRYILLPAAYQYEHYTKPDGSITLKYGKPSRIERTWEYHPRVEGKRYYNHFYVYDVRTNLYGTANNLPYDDVHPPTIVLGDSVYMFPNETAGFVWDGEYFGHHPEFVLKGKIKVLDWE